MTDIIKKVHQTIIKHSMVETGEKVTIALSGGPDSVFLLHALKNLQKELSIELSAVHIHHGIRQKEADRDCSFCENLCKSLNIPIFIKKLDIPKIAKETGCSFEEAGHWERLKAYKESRIHFKAKYTAVGHTLNDTAETLLMHLVMGAGKEGLAGIYPVIGYFLIRPLIELKKEEILSYLYNSQIEYMQDHTNQDNTMLRNRVRNLLIPLLEKEFNPLIIDSLARTASIFQEESAYFDEVVSACWDSYVNSSMHKISLDLREVDSFHPCILKHLLRKMVKTVKGDLKNISHHHTNNIYNLLKKDSGSSILLPEGLKAEKEYQRLIIKRADLDEPPSLSPLNITFPGVYHSKEWELIIKGEIIDTFSPKTEDNPTIIYLNYDECSDASFVVRQRKNGDRMQPLGMSGSKKVKDIFIDEKIPRRDREKTPIFEYKGVIVWIGGVKRSGFLQVDSSTKRVLKLSIEKIYYEYYDE